MTNKISTFHIFGTFWGSKNCSREGVPWVTFLTPWVTFLASWVTFLTPCTPSLEKKFDPQKSTKKLKSRNFICHLDRHFLKFLTISVGNQQRTDTPNQLQNTKVYSNLILHHPMNKLFGDLNLLALLVFLEILRHLRANSRKKMPILCVTCVYVWMYVEQ